MLRFYYENQEILFSCFNTQLIKRKRKKKNISTPININLFIRKYRNNLIRFDHVALINPKKTFDT